MPTINELSGTTLDSRNTELHDIVIDSYMTHDDSKLKALKGKYLNIKRVNWMNACVCAECHEKIKKIDEALNIVALYNTTSK